MTQNKLQLNNDKTQLIVILTSRQTNNVSISSPSGCDTEASSSVLNHGSNFSQIYGDERLSECCYKMLQFSAEEHWTNMTLSF